MTRLTITDESISGKILNEIYLQFETEYITAFELIESRVKEEVSRYENEQDDYSKGLVLPSDMEKRKSRRSNPIIDIEKQIFVALEAFKNNGFFILIGEEQVEKLEQRFLVDDTTKVTFIKLTALVGG